MPGAFDYMDMCAGDVFQDEEEAPHSCEKASKVIYTPAEPTPPPKAPSTRRSFFCMNTMLVSHSVVASA